MSGEQLPVRIGNRRGKIDSIYSKGLSGGKRESAAHIKTPMALKTLVQDTPKPFFKVFKKEALRDYTIVGSCMIEMFEIESTRQISGAGVIRFPHAHPGHPDPWIRYFELKLIRNIFGDYFR